jgi:hypothetical protein
VLLIKILSTKIKRLWPSEGMILNFLSSQRLTNYFLLGTSLLINIIKEIFKNYNHLNRMTSKMEFEGSLLLGGGKLVFGDKFVVGVDNFIFCILCFFLNVVLYYIV